MTGAHRRAPEPHRVRTALKSVWWLLLLLGLIAVVSATNSKYLQIVVLATQGIIMLDLASRLAVKVLRNRSPSPVILADWIGDGGMVIVWVALVLVDIALNLGWMHGAFEYAMFSIIGLFLAGQSVYKWRGQQRLVLLLTARSVAGQWPWSAAGSPSPARGSREHP